MKEIQEYADQIKSEMKGAKKYAKMALKWKEMGDATKGKYYYDMAQDELKHAMNIHTLAVKAIEEARKTVTPPQYMLDMWDREHEYYMEHAAKIKYMLAEYTK